MGVEALLKILTYAAAGIAFSSVASYVGLSCLVAFAFLLFLALVADFRNLTVLPRFVLNILAILAVVLSFLRIDAANLILPGVETLSVLLPLKLLERKGPRDYLQIYFLAILLLAGSSLFSLDMVFLAYLTAFILLLGGAAILVSFLAEEASLKLPLAAALGIGKQSLLITLIVIPVAGILFFILPRSNYPFFNFLNRDAVARSGFSDKVTLGNVSQIQMDEAVVMRVSMDRVDEQSLYWRGIVFDHFNGRTWQIKDQRMGGRYADGTGGRFLRYTVYLEPSEFNSIPTLDHPAYVMMRQLRRFDDHTYLATFPLNKKTSYEAVSILDNTIGGPERSIHRYLDVPTDMTRVKDLAADLTSHLGASASADRLESYLKKGAFTYALKGLPRSQQPLEDFLFTYRYGNCEYFASAMAVMLRFRGIPSRLVGGYRGGYYHDFGKYYVIPQRLAHVWVEAYLPPRGWVRFDPTPFSADISDSRGRMGALFRLKMAFDLLEYYWSMVIINYDFQKQINLFIKVPALFKPASFKFVKDQGILLAWTVLGVLFLGLGWFFMFRFKRMTRAERVLKAFLRRMKRLGYSKQPHEGLAEFTRSLPEGPSKSAALRFTDAFQKLYYTDHPLSRQDEKALRAIIRRLA